jgi:anti-sigma-K factor RskA
MDRELTRAELDELLPLYALDAVDGEEREQVTRYIERDTAARAEVQSLREAAAFLARPEARAPATLWARIEDSLAESTRDVRPTVGAPALASTGSSPRALPGSWPEAPTTTTRRSWRIAAATLAVAAVAAVIVLGVQVSRQQGRIDDLAAEMRRDPMRREAEDAKAAPGSRMVRLVSDDGTRNAEIVMLPDGTGYFMDHDLPKLAVGDTYQLWAKVGASHAAHMVSVGVLGGQPGIVPFRLAAPASRFVVTREGMPGSTDPGAAVVMSGDVT